MILNCKGQGMPYRLLYRFSVLFAFAVITSQSRAHVPYLENNDFSVKQPFEVEHTIEQSLAIYAWLETNESGISVDIDVFVFRINEPANVYLEVLVPVCPGYEEFRPWIALAGPGLARTELQLPFDIPPDYGIEVIQNVSGDAPRETFYEIFGGKSYYKGPVYNEYITIPGVYRVYVWDPQQKSGDYVAVLGKKEIWRFSDVIRAFRNTPLIRLGRELHTDCPDPTMDKGPKMDPVNH